MEAIAALSLACNVMQTLAVTREVIVVTKAIYKTGTTIINTDLADRADELSKLSTGVQAAVSSAAPSTTSPPGPEKDLLDIAKRCVSVASTLRAEIDKLDVVGTKGSRGKALFAAVKSRVRRSRIEDLEKSVDQWQKMLDSSLLFKLCSTSNAQALQHETRFSSFDAELRTLIQELANGNANLEVIVTKAGVEVQEHVTQELAASQAVIIDHISTEAQATQTVFQQGISNFRLATESEESHRRLIDSLRLDGMNWRENNITESFETTFEWIYSEDLQKWDSFAKWLTSDAKFYWISGKPGSGKSTLMKFIRNEEKTSELLAPDTLILAYYLWAVGSDNQKTVRGLLCTLLHQLLTHKPTLATGVLNHIPGSSAKYEETDWSRTDALKALSKAVEDSPSPICIFIDGLDEVSPEDGPDDLMDVIEQISVISRVKVCIASRPEPSFKKRYRHVPGLRLQDLNEQDIRDMCQVKLQALGHDLPATWVDTEGDEHDLDDIVGELVDKAEGVFLWVHLVLQSIRRGRGNSDSWETISKRINTLPRDLDKLYLGMWERANIDRGIYESTSALYLQLVLDVMSDERLSESWKHVSLFGLTVATLPNTHERVLDRERFINPTQLKSLCDDTAAMVEAHCGGLLMISYKDKKTMDHRKAQRIYSRPKKTESEDDKLVIALSAMVTFIHRSALDFLRHTPVGRDILGKVDTPSPVRSFHMALAALARLRFGITSMEECRQLKEKILALLSTFTALMPDTVSPQVFTTIFGICEDIWNRHVRDEQTRAGLNTVLPDLLGFAAMNGEFSIVETVLRIIEEVDGAQINSLYVEYLIHSLSISAKSYAFSRIYFHQPPEAKLLQSRGIILLLRRLLDKAPKADSDFYVFELEDDLLEYPWCIHGFRLCASPANAVLSGYAELANWAMTEFPADWCPEELGRILHTSAQVLQLLLTKSALADFEWPILVSFSAQGTWFIGNLTLGETIYRVLRHSHHLMVSVNTIFLLQRFIYTYSQYCHHIEGYLDCYQSLQSSLQTAAKQNNHPHVRLHWLSTPLENPQADPLEGVPLTRSNQYGGVWARLPKTIHVVKHELRKPALPTTLDATNDILSTIDSQFAFNTDIEQPMDLEHYLTDLSAKVNKLLGEVHVTRITDPELLDCWVSQAHAVGKIVKIPEQGHHGRIKNGVYPPTLFGDVPADDCVGSVTSAMRRKRAAAGAKEHSLAICPDISG